MERAPKDDAGEGTNAPVAVAVTVAEARPRGDRRGTTAG